MTRSITDIIGASGIRRPLHAIMTFALPLCNGLNEGLHLNIIDEALLDKALVLNPESNTNALSSNASTYRGEEVESMLGYVNKDVIVHVT